MKKTDWKKNKNFKPQILLSKIEEIKNIHEDGTIGFSVFEYENAKAALMTMLDIGPEIEANSLSDIIHATNKRCAQEDDFSKSRFLEILNLEIKDFFKKPIQNYHFLTSISIDGNLPFKTFKYNNLKIRLLDNYPKKYQSRNDGIIGYDNYKEPKPYKKVIIEISKSTPNEAMETALYNLDVIRGILCILINPELSLSLGGPSKPINSILLGGLHSLHHEDGNQAVKYWWYEPTYKEIKTFQFTVKHANIMTNVRWFVKQLNKSPYKKEIENAIVRYVRAFDGVDMNTVLIQGWSALETLLSKYNSDLIIRRCSYLYVDYQYQRQILEHLREYRNSFVHQGNSNGEIYVHCYQIQSYFSHLIQFYLHFADFFNSLDEANSFLDFPIEEQALRNKIRLSKRALKYRQYE